MEYCSALPSWNLHGKRVFLRADLNVPLANGTIMDDFKLKQLIPTLNLILKKESKIILATHIGRPDYAQPELSTRHLVPWFTHQGYSVQFCETIESAFTHSKHDLKTIVLLENLRFFPGEKNHDPEFAAQLKKLADVYVNDAFGTLHRTDTSVLALPELFLKNQRTFGLLIQSELRQAQKLMHPKRPFCLIVGGGKVKNKLPLITALLPQVNSLLLCPAIDKAIHDDKTIFESIAQTAKKDRITIEFPQDYLVGKDLVTGPFSIKKSTELMPADFPICIGPETQKKYAHIICQSKTAFYNGLMGNLDNPETLTGVYALFTAMQKCDFALIGGGDSTAAARKLGFEKKIALSTGGGALLAYVSGQKMPALEVLAN